MPTKIYREDGISYEHTPCPPISYANTIFYVKFSKIHVHYKNVWKNSMQTAKNSIDSVYMCVIHAQSFIEYFPNKNSNHAKR